jgi:hypothetical protein
MANGPPKLAGFFANVQFKYFSTCRLLVCCLMFFYGARLWSFFFGITEVYYSARNYRCCSIHLKPASPQEGPPSAPRAGRLVLLSALTPPPRPRAPFPQKAPRGAPRGRARPLVVPQADRRPGARRASAVGALGRARRRRARAGGEKQKEVWRLNLL